MKDFDKIILRNARLHSLLAYIVSAMLVGDIGELDTFTKMLPVIEKDLGKMTKLVWPNVKKFSNKKWQSLLAEKSGR